VPHHLRRLRQPVRLPIRRLLRGPALQRRRLAHVQHPAVHTHAHRHDNEQLSDRLHGLPQHLRRHLQILHERAQVHRRHRDRVAHVLAAGLQRNRVDGACRHEAGGKDRPEEGLDGVGGRGGSLLAITI